MIDKVINFQETYGSAVVYIIINHPDDVPSVYYTIS